MEVAYGVEADVAEVGWAQAFGSEIPFEDHSANVAAHQGDQLAEKEE